MSPQWDSRCRGDGAWVRGVVRQVVIVTDEISEEAHRRAPTPEHHDGRGEPSSLVHSQWLWQQSTVGGAPQRR
jgi:hypothetical protein